MTSLQTSLQQIEAWLHAHAPSLLERLPPGASDQDLAQAEAMMGGLTLPDDFKEAYRRHNGWGLSFIFGGSLCLYPLADVIGTWQRIRDSLEAGGFGRGLNWKHAPFHFELADPIRPVWWHLGWVPFAWSEQGEYWAMDLAPAPGGTNGQVIYLETGPGYVQATSLEAIFTEFAEDLEAGRYRLSKSSLTDWGFPRSHPLPVFSLARQLLKQAYDAGHAIATRDRVWMNESVAQQMLPPLLAMLDLEETQLEDRLLACEWLLLIHLSLNQRAHVKALLPRCQREAEQAPPYYEIHHTLRKAEATLAGT